MSFLFENLLAGGIELVEGLLEEQIVGDGRTEIPGLGSLAFFSSSSGLLPHNILRTHFMLSWIPQSKALGMLKSITARHFLQALCIIREERQQK